MPTIECWPSGATAECDWSPGGGSSSISDGNPNPTPLGTLQVNVNEQVAGSRGNGWVRIQFPSLPDPISIPFSWNRVPPLRAIPPLVFLGVLEPGTKVRRTVKIGSRDEREFSLARVRESNESIRVLTQPGDLRALEHEFDVVITAPNDPGAYRQSVSVSTDLDNTAPLVVLFSGVVRAP